MDRLLLEDGGLLLNEDGTDLTLEGSILVTVPDPCATCGRETIDATPDNPDAYVIYPTEQICECGRHYTGELK